MRFNKSHHMLVASIAGLLAAPASAQTSPAENQDTKQVEVKDTEKFAAELFLPTSKWRLSRKGEGCTIRRDFAHEDGRVATLTWQRVHPASTVQVGLFGDGITRTRDILKTQFVPASGYGEHGFVAGASLGEKTGVAFATRLFAETRKVKGLENQNEALRQLEAEATHYVVTGASRKPVALATGPVTAALSALDKCAKDELEAMGVSDNLQSGAQPFEQVKWAKKLQQNYPAEALRANWSGPVPVRLVINEKGRVEVCQTLHQIAAASLRKAACDGMIEHARFKPARDSGGNPTKDIYITRVIYSLTNTMAVDAHGMLVRKIKN